MTTSVTVTRISDGTIINAPPELIWKTLRDFSTIAQWHPAVQDCIIEGGGPADRAGAVRAISSAGRRAIARACHRAFRQRYKLQLFRYRIAFAVGIPQFDS